MLFVASFVKEITINEMRRLDHQWLTRPETRSFKWLGYRLGINLAVCCTAFHAANIFNCAVSICL